MHPPPGGCLPTCDLLTCFDVTHPAARYTEGLERMQQVAAERSSLVEALQQFDGAEVTQMSAPRAAAQICSLHSAQAHLLGN
jgi:hypothetical protein